MRVQADKLFAEDYKSTMIWFRDLEMEKDESYFLIRDLVTNLLRCEERKNENKANIFYESLSRLEK